MAIETAPAPAHLKFPLGENQRVLALVSGSASTAYAIYEATQDGRLPLTEFCGLVLSNPNAGEYFRRNPKNLPPVNVHLAYRKSLNDSLGYGIQLILTIDYAAPTIVGQYGFDELMPAVTINYCRDWEITMINQHPGPINPDYYDFGGKYMSCSPRVHCAVLMYQRELAALGQPNAKTFTEVIAQRVGLDFDSGPVLKRRQVDFGYEDTPESLNERAKPLEWETQIATLKDAEEGSLTDQPPSSDLVLPHQRELLTTAKQVSRGIYTRNGALRPNLTLGEVMSWGEINDSEGHLVAKLLNHIKYQLAV